MQMMIDLNSRGKSDRKLSRFTRKRCLTLFLFLSAFSLPLEAKRSYGLQQDKNPANDKVYDSEKRTEGFLTPEKSLKSWSFPSGFEARLFAAEPDVRQPIAGTTDDRGRLWVCENFTYSESKLNFDLDLSDRILILEDKDGDGRAESHKVFWTGGKRLTSIAIGFDGVFVTCAPQLLFLPDRNHDDIPDGPPEVLLDGWNDDAVRHNIVNGLMWGPDGWLYGRHGIMATSFVGPPESSPSQRTAINCGIWRYHPLHKKFEVVAHGTTNPWGMDFNNEGDLFMINTVIGHLWHVVPGARYERMYGSHFNPYTYRSMQQTADHFHWNKSGGEAWHQTKKTGMTQETDRFGGGHAHCGLLFYGDKHWPSEFHNTLLTCNFHGLRINCDRIEKKGNGYVGKHNPDFAKTTDHWFRGIELVRDFDGGFYLLDWQDTGECHENDGVHRSSGRVYKVSYGKRSIPTPSLMTASHEKLFQLLSGERWEFQQALLEVRRRVRNGALNIEDLAVVIDIANRMPRHSMIRESLAGDVGADKIYPESLARLLQKELNTPKSSEVGQRFVRELIRVSINEALIRNKPLLSGTQLASLAKKAQPATRLTLASLLNRLPDKEAIQLGKSLLQFDEDGLDNFQPLLIWYGIEPSVGRDPRVGFEMAETSRIPLVTQLITRRLCEEIEKPEVGRRLFGLLETCSGEYRTSVLTGIYQAVLGRRKLESPPGWADGLKKISLNEAQRELVGQINVIFGDGQSIAELVKTARKGSEDPRIRGRAIMTLAELNPSATRELLDQYLGDRDLRQYVIEAYAFCQDTDIGKKIIAQFSRLKPDGKKAAINTLSKRVVWSRELLKAIEDGKIPKGFLTAWHARQISNLGNQDLTIELEKVWGKIRQTSVEKEAEMEALKFLLESELRTSGQSKEWMSDGAKLFEKSCANCHVLYGKGGRIGPDLTGSNRKDLGYLLENIIDPSSSVAESYQASVIELVDGRTLTGVVTKQSQSIVEVQTAERKLVIDRNEIERMKPTKESLMPEGLIKDYSAEQKRALFWFLRNR